LGLHRREGLAGLVKLGGLGVNLPALGGQLLFLLFQLPLARLERAEVVFQLAFRLGQPVFALGEDFRGGGLALFLFGKACLAGLALLLPLGQRLGVVLELLAGGIDVGRLPFDVRGHLHDVGKLGFKLEALLGELGLALGEPLAFPDDPLPLRPYAFGVETHVFLRGAQGLDRLASKLLDATRLRGRGFRFDGWLDDQFNRSPKRRFVARRTLHTDRPATVGPGAERTIAEVPRAEASRNIAAAG